MMVAPDDFDGLLAEYVLGTLSDDERAEVQRVLETSPDASARLEAVRARLDAPAPTGHWPAFNAVAAWLEGGRRFEHLVPRLATLLGISEVAARALVDTLDDDDVWEDGPDDGVESMPVDAPGAGAVVYRVQPGATLRLPKGRRLVLEGSYRDATAAEFWRGQHDEGLTGDGLVTALEGPPCLCVCVTAAGARP
jgi:hypothetical protein